MIFNLMKTGLAQLCVLTSFSTDVGTSISAISAVALVPNIALKK